MTRIFLVATLTMACFMTSCNGSGKPPNAGPVSVLRNDQYIYPWGKFYASAGQDNVHLGFVHPSQNAPIIWVKGKPVNILTVTTPPAIISRIGEPDNLREDGELVYRPQGIGAGIPSVEFKIKNDTVITVTIQEQGGISLTEDSEVLTIPFSRKDLIRVFGPPKEFIESR